MNYRQIYARKAECEKRIKEVCPQATHESGIYCFTRVDEDGFKFADGSVLQFAVYNAHNGYYGHPIIIAKDKEILLQDTL